MCQFVSWIEKDNEIYFITANDINTPEGRKLKKYLGDYYWEDIKGHGAIRYYYGLRGGTDKECNFFDNPELLPDKIVKAIKRGAFRGIAIPNKPEQFLLSRPLVKYHAQCIKLKAERRAKCAQPSNSKSISILTYIEYKKKYAPIDDEYITKCNDVFWDIFSKKSNRLKIWR